MADNAVMRQFFQLCGMSNAQPNMVTQQFIDSQDFTNILDLDLYRPEEAKGMIDNHNGDDGNHRIGTTVQRKLEGLIFWVNDRTRRNLPVDIGSFNLQELRNAMIRYRIAKSKEDNSDSPKDIKKIETGIGWEDWNDKFENYLAAIPGSGSVPLDYVIRRDKPAEWNPATDAANEHEKIKYQVSLQGPEFQADDQAVFLKLKELTQGEPAYEWVREFEGNMSGRRAMQSLRTHFEGLGEVSKRVTLAESAIQNAHYRNEFTFSFEKYATKLKQAYTILEKHGQPHAKKTQVKRLHDGMNVSNNVEISIAKSKMLDDYREDFNGAVTYMSLKVAEIFPRDSEGSRRKGKVGRGGDQSRYIAELESQTKRGRMDDFRRGGGRDHGRGGDRGGGRWHRGGRVNSNEGPNSVIFNGIDCTNPTRDFNQQEWQQMGPAGHAYVHNQRTYMNNRGGNPRGGFQGRGQSRGGRGRGRGPHRNIRQVQFQDQHEGNQEPPNDQGNGNGEEPPATNNDPGGGGRGSNRGGRNGGRFGRGNYRNHE